MSIIEAPVARESARKNTQPSKAPAPPPGDTEANPDSAVQRVYVEVAEGVRVPVRKINLTDGEPFFVYDTGGPQDHEIREGLPPLREPWIRGRGDCDEVAAAERPGRRSI